MKNSPYFRLSGLILLLVGLVLFSMARNQKKKEHELASNLEEIQLVKDEVSTHFSGIQKPTIREVIQKNLEKSTEVKNDQTLINTKRTYTSEEIKKMSEYEFSNLLKNIEANLPTVSSIRELPAGALHHVPAPVLEAGRELGLIKEILNEHPEFQKAAVEFYDNCSLNEESPQSVRALCLTNLIQTKKQLSQKVNLKSYPKEIIELSRLVIDL